ncbi:MAG: cell division ATP-binding protein FtsE [Ruminococcaceae bacterium]|nr:cell division ATP-binding protein FtsE [Oscillospiraceae bacterium]
MIEFNKVSKTYNGKEYILKNLDLTIRDGEFVFIVGHSGAGKTTLTKLLLREEKLSSGTLHIGKYKLERLRNFRVPQFRRTIGVVFQDFKLLENKTVYENVAFALQIVGTKKKEIDERVRFFLDLVELSDKADSFPSQLSGGEKQRACLARAIINRPDIIIADEPTGNLDPVLSFDIMNLLVRINAVVGRTVIVVTHEKQLVDHFNKRVVTIENGEIISDKAGGYDNAQTI